MDKAAKLETLLGGLTFPEGPRWRDGRLYLSDFFSHRVLRVDGAGKSELVATIPQRPSGLGWMPDGALLIVSMLDRKVMKLAQGKLSVHADLSAIAGGPCNDMVVDRMGRAYVGNFGYDRHAGEAERPTALARIDPDGKVSRAAENVTFPNGTAITPDGKRLILAETHVKRLTQFDIAADGGLSDRRLFAEFADCTPDGICLDAEGAVWVADPTGKRVLRVFEGGRVAQAISTAPRGSYACILGGDDRRTLFILTNTGSGPAMAEKTDGRVEFLRVDIPGAGLP